MCAICCVQTESYMCWVEHDGKWLGLELPPAKMWLVTFLAVGCSDRYFSGRPLNSHIVKIKQKCDFRT